MYTALLTGLIIVSIIFIIAFSVISLKLRRFSKEQQDMLTLSQYTQKALNRNVREAEQRLQLAREKMDMLQLRLDEAETIKVQTNNELLRVKNLSQIVDNHVSRKIRKKKKVSKKRRKAA